MAAYNNQQNGRHMPTTLFVLYLGLLVLVLVLRLLVFVVCHLLLGGLFRVQLDREADELRVLLHEVLHLSLLQELGHVLLQDQLDAGAASEGLGVRAVLK